MTSPITWKGRTIFVTSSLFAHEPARSFLPSSLVFTKDQTILPTNLFDQLVAPRSRLRSLLSRVLWSWLTSFRSLDSVVTPYPIFRL